MFVITKIEKCEHCIDGKFGIGKQDPVTLEWTDTVEVNCGLCEYGKMRSDIPFTEFAQTPEFQAAVNDALAKFSRAFNGNEEDGH